MTNPLLKVSVRPLFMEDINKPRDAFKNKLLVRMQVKIVLKRVLNKAVPQPYPTLSPERKHIMMQQSLY